ncbi:MAG: VapC toxin family PIN domain ribonuclease [Promicromonosporaceae bacterium]|nr:VapC toxin family PIN domain ribonuclease [Promicromonosporaceae bacterium]
MAVTEWLLDKSAYVRLYDQLAVQNSIWGERVNRGLVRIPAIARLELAFSARNGKEGRQDFITPPLSLMPVEYLTPKDEDRALEVQLLLADKGQHRAASIPDLLTAAIAERRRLTVLCADKDYDLIGEVTGQPVENLSAG